MASGLLPLLLVCVLASASAYENRFVFNGFGRFLCDEYGGVDNICSPPSTDRETRSVTPKDCSEICSTCTEEDIWEDLDAFMNPDPALDLNGNGVQVTGEVAATTGLCDAAKSWSTANLDPVTIECQLQYVRWRFGDKCRTNSPGNTGVRFAILRPQNGTTADQCQFTVMAEVELTRTHINQLLDPETSGVAQYNLTNVESALARAEPGDHFGFRWTGSGVAEFTNGVPGDKNSCLAPSFAWNAGDEINLTTLSDSRYARIYSIEYGCLPY